MLARQEAQMNLMKQAVEVRGQGSEGREGGSAQGSPCCPSPPPAHTLSCDPLISQMYVQHDIYDLIFKYVGTMEASEVSSKSSSTRMKALFFAF